MGQQEEAPDPHQGFTPGNMASIFYLLVCGYAACFWPLMRVRFGVRAFQKHGIFAMLVMYIYGLAYTCLDAMVAFWAVWMVALFIARVEAVSRGQRRYSYDDGVPWMANLLRPPSEFVAKGAYEGIILFLAGVALSNTVSPGLGMFVGLGGVPLFVKVAIERAMWQASMREAEDTRHRMRAYADSFRNRH
jgi:hypothetical protein